MAHVNMAVRHLGDRGPSWYAVEHGRNRATGAFSAPNTRMLSPTHREDIIIQGAEKSVSHYNAGIKPVFHWYHGIIIPDVA